MLYLLRSSAISTLKPCNCNTENRERNNSQIRHSLSQVDTCDGNTLHLVTIIYWKSTCAKTITMLKILLIVSLSFSVSKATSVFLDLNQHSECNQVENALANEVAELARQRAEFIHWSHQRIYSILNQNSSKSILCFNVMQPYKRNKLGSESEKHLKTCGYLRYLQNYSIFTHFPSK